jgi:hypothetical protein
MNTSPYFKLEIFVPEEVVDVVLSALAEAHAGEIGLYDHCAAVSEVQSSWHALPGANPAVGEPDHLYSGVEYKIEVNCREEFLLDAVAAVREVHPYEEPVINIYPLANARYGGTV